VVGGRVPVRQTRRSGTDQGAGGAQLDLGIEHWPTRGGDGLGPGYVAEGLSTEKFAVAAVQHIQKAIAIGLYQQLARLALPGRIDQNRNLRGIVVVQIMRGELEVPHQLAVVWIERQHGVAVEVVTIAFTAVTARSGISGGPVQQVQRRIVGSREPCRHAAGLPGVPRPASLPRLPRTRYRLEA